MAKKAAGVLGADDIGHLVKVEVGRNAVIQDELVRVEHGGLTWDQWTTLTFRELAPASFGGYTVPATRMVRVGDLVQQEVPF
jgi:hypothetical protein